MNRPSIRFLIVILVTAIVTGVFYGQERFLNKARRGVIHLHDAREHLLLFIVKMRGMEDAQLKYILSGRSELIAPYGEALGLDPAKNPGVKPDSSMFEELDTLKMLATGHPRQLANLDSLRHLVDQRLAYSRHIIRMRDEKGLNAALQEAGKGVGLNLANEIAVLVQSMTEQGREVAGRVASAENQELRIHDAVVYGSILIFFCGLLLAVGLENRHRQQRLKVEQALERVKQDFISTVSHELRTPLTSIRGALGLAASGAVGVLPEKASELVSIAYRNSEQLSRIINDILDIEKIESGKVSFQIQSADATAFLRQVLEANRSYGDKFGVRFVLKDSSQNLQVLADPDRLAQILNNLLSNAAKFSPSGSEVWVASESRGKFVRFSVRDFGPGIPKDFHHLMFEKFAQRGNEDDQRSEGTGLGLSITKKLVEAMHGSIGFETEPGKGTTFNVDLPQGRS